MKPMAPLDLAAFLSGPHARVVLDLGCGDARATARLAAAEPDALVIGVDANLDAAARVMRRARRTPEKGGLPNLLLVMASADRMPRELDGGVDELRIDLPWGSLLVALLDADPTLWAGLGRTLAPGGRLRIVLNARSLPAEMVAEEASRRLEAALGSIGLEGIETTSTAIEPDTGWGKRLAGGRPLPVIVAEGARPAA